MAGVNFELERFEWVGDDRLELVGRWSGLRGHRFLRPTLDVDVNGERRRMLADLEHKPWAPEEGEDWMAAFRWRGEPVRFDEAELTVAPELAVALPPASGASARKGGRADVAQDVRPARRPRTAVLEAELESAMSEADDLREKLRAEQTNVRGLETQLQHAREELESARAAVEENERLRSERDEAAAARDAAEKERDGARAEAEEARGTAAKATAEAADARRERDAATDRLAEAERESASLTEARDRAREERNAWMQRARATAAAGRPRATVRPAVPEAEPTPPVEEPPQEEPTAETAQAPAPERRTVLIGERHAPGPPPRPEPHLPARSPFLEAWGPRLAVAGAALAVLAAVVFVLLTWAL